MLTRLVGVAIFVIATLYTWVGKDYSAQFSDVLGPSVFPVIVGIASMALAASVVVFPGGNIAVPERGRMLRQLAALVVLIGYAWLLKPLGFPLATFGLIFLLALVLEGDTLKSAIIGFCMSLGLWVLFDQVLGLPLSFLGTLFGGK